MTIAVLDDRCGGALIQRRPAGTATPRPDLRQPIVWGMLVVFGLVGGFTTWAAVCPLSSAAVAPGTVAVETKRKTVQHLEGGIVRELLVREGERVAAGQLLVRLDTTQAETTWQDYRGQLVAARAQEGRLLAERDGLDAIRFPAALEAEALSEETVRTVLQGQRTIFQARRAALAGERQILSERVGQLRSQVAGLQAQEQATLDQSGLIQEELSDVRGLVDKGLERRSRLRALERQAADLAGRLGEYRGNIARVEQMIGETRLQIIDLDNRRTEEVVADLRQTQTQIADLQERVRAAEDVLRRRDIRAPVAGSIVNLKMVTPGGVVTPGAALLEIVPEDDTLTVQARIRPTDIDSVHSGLAVKVRLTAFKARTTPMLDGKLVYVSADTLVDPRTGTPYYDARIEVDRHELERLKQVHLYPGMPVETMVVTGERTLLAYLVQPLHDSMTRAFRED